MSKQVKWTKDVLNAFIQYAMLNDDEVFIMETRIKGWSVTKQAMKLNKSESTIHKMIALLKKKYDAVQLEHPNEMPVRRASSKETWMDNH